jgi:hypothetical protein
LRVLVGKREEVDQIAALFGDKSGVKAHDLHVMPRKDAQRERPKALVQRLALAGRGPIGSQFIIMIGSS